MSSRSIQQKLNLRKAANSSPQESRWFPVSSSAQGAIVVVLMSVQVN
jgi:hypothetical protein